MPAPTIAVLDNDPCFLSLMHDLLAEEGYAPLLWRARDEPDPHALLREALPDLVILDLWLERPDDGWTFLAQLRADPATVHIPVIVASGQPDTVSPVREPQWARYCRRIQKPFDLQDLLDAIAAALGPSPALRGRDLRRSQTIPPVDPPVPDLPDYPLAAEAGVGI